MSPLVALRKAASAWDSARRGDFRDVPGEMNPSKALEDAALAYAHAVGSEALVASKVRILALEMALREVVALCSTDHNWVGHGAAVLADKIERHVETALGGGT